MRRAIALAAIAATLAIPTVASASTSAITRAEASPGWSTGSLAGSATWTDCNTSGCSWLPYATVIPALPEYRCQDVDFFDSDPNTRPIWQGAQQTANGVQIFDLPSIAILAGVHGQRLCVSAVEYRYQPEQLCLNARIVFPDLECPPVLHRFFRSLGSGTLLTVVAPTGTQDTREPEDESPADSRQPALQPIAAKRATKALLARKLGRRWRKGSNRQVSCSRRSSTKLRCKATWRYDGKGRKATVVVAKTAAGVKAKLV